MDNKVQKIRQVYKSAESKYAKLGINPDKEKVSELLSSVFSPGEAYQLVFDIGKFEFDFVTDSVEDMLGISPSEYSMEHLFNCIQPDDRDHYANCEKLVHHFIFEHIDPLDMTNYKMTYQYRMKTRSGDYKMYLHQVIALTVSDKGQLSKTFFNHTDIDHITKTRNDTMSMIGINGRPSYYNIGHIDDLTRLKLDAGLNLTNREVEILRLASEGFKSKEIGEMLHISFDTVRTHRQNILAKCDAKNLTHAVAMAIRKGAL